MGEGRYFTANGAYPQDGYGLEKGGRVQGAGPALRDDLAWTRPQWPGHGATQPDLSSGYAPHPASAPQTAWAQPAAVAYGAARQGASGTVPPAALRAEPRLSVPPQAMRQPAQAPYPVTPRVSGYAQPSYGHDPYYDDGAAYSAPEYAQAPNYDDPVTQARRADPPPVSMGAMARGFGALLSLGLLVAGGVWTWQMMQRDVSGVPVVRALEGPLRVVPENPGGMQAAHQGLSVNELAADGEAELPNEIVLAPQPLDLNGDLSQPAQTLVPMAPPETLIEVGFPVPSGQDAPAVAAPLGIVSPNRSAVTRSPRPATRSSRAAAAPQLGQAESVPADAALAAAVANSVAADLSRNIGIDVDPASIGPGTRLVQLGAYDSAAEAKAAWDRLAQRFDPLLDDRGRVIEAAHSGGSVFYRLRAHGFSDERDARRFCAALIDQRLDCIPVLIR